MVLYLIKLKNEQKPTDHFSMILDAVEQVGGIYVVTADHGNAEDMVKRNKTGQPLLDKRGNTQILTSCTLQPSSYSIFRKSKFWPLASVPVAIGGPGLALGVWFRKDLPSGGLANVAATMINLHGFEALADYESSLMKLLITRKYKAT
ncbi:putative phosphoglycerate mutase (2,3-diphosphoglycerate-independent) [Rosa chinensis]|uniref:Putative phosphoglycerate mutase (2,3-diphosphoglycerate-independent) n=1 Tax=Rosa chinensis TaxID=74649 RepID=A0A2P6S134_ROSCH|nr:putative phosphoglycerate mutase (2,3-diphosphoglycerate-independent) [Rosa chinensis]